MYICTYEESLNQQNTNRNFIKNVIYPLRKEIHIYVYTTHNTHTLHTHTQTHTHTSPIEQWDILLQAQQTKKKKKKTTKKIQNLIQCPGKTKTKTIFKKEIKIKPPFLYETNSN